MSSSSSIGKSGDDVIRSMGRMQFEEEDDEDPAVRMAALDAMARAEMSRGGADLFDLLDGDE